MKKSKQISEEEEASSFKMSLENITMKKIPERSKD